MCGVMNDKFLHFAFVHIISLYYYCVAFLNHHHLRFGRPGVDCHVRHDTDMAVIQIMFLINEVS